MVKTTSIASCCALLALLVLQTAIASGFNYGDALDKSLLFFEAQRSGKLPRTQRVKWRGDSGLGDGFAQGVDLVGGYYDAGDHVKFGLPMAYSVTMLSWAAIEYRKDIAGLNQLGNALSAIKWGTDYFIKAHSQYNTLWGQVGDGDSDHYCWERAEDMATSRTAYKVDANSPGSDLAGETAAALAAASIAFKPYNSSYSNLLLLHAKQLFTFADSFRGLYDDSISIAKNFYTSSGYSDELLWAATWLFQATNDQYYLKYVADNGASMGGTGWAVREFSWDNKYAGVQILLSKVLLEGRGGAYTSVLKQYQATADFFACSCAQKNNGYNVDKTPGGLVYVREWNNLQYAASAAFITAVYSDYLSQARATLQCPDGKVSPQELLNFAKSQADYILGKNPKSISYLVGYGKNYPHKVHHRGASIASMSVYRATVGCVEGFESWYRRSQSDPNTIYGALVGGPSKNDDFNDDRSNYEQTEPTISGTAPLIGLFSKLASLSGNSGSYHQKWPLPHKAPPSYYEYHPKTPSTNTKPGNYKFSPKVSPAPYTKAGPPIQFFHSITDAWTIKKTTYYRHKVVLKNKSQKSIKDLKLRIENLTGSVWGLTQTKIKHVYQLPQWIPVLKPGSEFSFVYVQGGPQAKVFVQSYQ